MILPSFDIGIADPRGTIGLMNLDRLIDMDEDQLDQRMRIKIEAARKAVQRLRAGWRPGPEMLDRAPRLHNWNFVELGPQRVILVGTVIGHPRLGERPLIQTSYLIGLDATHLKWARTLSRFYALGEPSDYPMG